ncbi:MAG TPA: apolipoprotein N-acyltransferase [Gallionella sp.]|nr:apolipoprotein N-acyltransferase [Gallionella sp.]
MSQFRKLSLAAFAAGLLCVAGFAPFGWFPVPVLALAVLFALWAKAATPRAAAWQGFAFGLGLFAGGISWIYVALHDYGEMPLPLAALATLLFAAFLALLPALAGYVQARVMPRSSSFVALVLSMPAAWVLVEWVRGMLFTGFPWLTLGYAHSDSPLAGYASLLGVYGVSLVAAASAGLLAMLWRERWNRRGQLALALLVVLWGCGAALRSIVWTQPQGEPFSVALVQGNIAQDLKFNEDALVSTLETYRRLTLQSDARLIVLPETALPMLRHEVPGQLVAQFAAHAQRNAGGVLIGSFVREGDAFHNSVFALTGEGREQRYHKQHLVPFGEFIPLRLVLGWFINEVLNIPMGDLTSGGTHQPPLEVAGQRVAVNICYEDVFGEEIIRALPQATLLVNVTNDAWYGDSFAAEQHAQISRMRALETGRMMLRATNTGVTAIIGVDGRVLQQLPQHHEGVLSGMAQGYAGSTPYVRWGNGAVMALLLGMLGVAWRRRTAMP